MNIKRILPFLLAGLVLTLLLLSGCGKNVRARVEVTDFLAEDMPFDDGTGIKLAWKPVDKTHRVIQYNIYRGYNPDSLFFLSKIEVDAKTGFAGDQMTYYDMYYSPLIDFETAPAKLKTEGGLTSVYTSPENKKTTSKLYKGVPRDVRILSTMIDHYGVMGDINAPKFYKASHEVKPEGGDQTFAGFKFSQFNNIYAYPLADNTYYYCVVPVSETGQLLQPSEVMAATPRYNRPDNTARLYSAYLKDKQELRFEWNPPDGNYSINHWEVWLLPQTQLAAFQKDQQDYSAFGERVFQDLQNKLQEYGQLSGEYDEELQAQKAIGKARAESVLKQIALNNRLNVALADSVRQAAAGDPGLAQRIAAWIQDGRSKSEKTTALVAKELAAKNKLAQPLADVLSSLLEASYDRYAEIATLWSGQKQASQLRARQAKPILESAQTFAKTVYYDKVSAANAKSELPPEDQLAGLIPILVYYDELPLGFTQPAKLYASAVGEPINFHSSAELPQVPSYTVMDKPNDKGDNLVVSFGKPIAFITQGVYANHAKTKLRLNYEISGNGHQTVDKLKFSFLDLQGKPLGELKEQYPDKIINFHLPKGIARTDSLIVRIYSKLTGEKDFAPDFTEQKIKYTAKSMIFMGGTVLYEGQELNGISYDILKKDKTAPTFSTGMRIGALSRSYDHTIEYPTTINPPIALMGYDAKSKCLLAAPNFLVGSQLRPDDPTQTLDFYPSLYKKDYDAYVSGLKKEIAELQASVAKAGKDTLVVSLDAPGFAPIPDLASLKDKQAELAYLQTNPNFLAADKAKNDKEWRRLLLKSLEENTRSYTYRVIATNGRGLWSDETDFPSRFSKVLSTTTWLHPKGEWFDSTKLATLIASLLLGIIVVYTLLLARRKEMYIRKIAGLDELDNAVGRATEMGRPVMFVPGWGSLGDVDTIASMMILSQIARKTAEYDIRLVMPNVDYFVVPLAQEIVQTAYSEAGRPDAYNPNEIFFVSDSQFAFCAAVNGITVRERVATVFYMGYFFAEALLMTETGNQSGAIQIAATDAITQIPFFITTCDYTLIGEEFYAASAYLSRHPDLVGMLKAQDYFKIIIVVGVLVGTALSSLGINSLLNFLPFE